MSSGFCLAGVLVSHAFYQLLKFESYAIILSGGCRACRDIGGGVSLQLASLAFGECAQHSVHPTGGSLRVFKQFAWLETGSAKVELPRPAHQRVTQTVGRLNQCGCETFEKNEANIDD